jgi:hypothetical protein
MEIQLLAVIFSEDELGGGYAANLLARNGDIIQKNLHLFGRYKQICHTWGTMEALILGLSWPKPAAKRRAESHHS